MLFFRVFSSELRPALFFRVFSSELRPARSILLTSRVFHAVARLINGKIKRRFSTGQLMKKEAFMLQSRNTRTQLKYQKREVVQTDTQLQLHVKWNMNFSVMTLHNACTVLKYLSSCYFKSLIAFATGKSRNKWYLSQAWVEKET